MSLITNLMSELQLAIPKIPVYQVSQQFPKHFRFTLKSAPFSIFHFEFCNPDTRFVTSDPKNTHTTSFVSIVRKLQNQSKIVAIFYPLFEICYSDIKSTIYDSKNPHTTCFVQVVRKNQHYSHIVTILDPTFLILQI